MVSGPRRLSELQIVLWTLGARVMVDRKGSVLKS